MNSTKRRIIKSKLSKFSEIGTNSFYQLKDIIPKVIPLEKVKIENPPESVVAVSFWPDIVPEKYKKVSRAIDLKEGRLIVEVTEPVWKQELLMQKRLLIKNINQKTDRPVVGDISFRVRNFIHGE